MEKMLLNSINDYKKSVKFFGQKYRNDISHAIKLYPCILIGHYSEDVEFGSGYSFTTVNKGEFENDAGLKYF